MLMWCLCAFIRLLNGICEYRVGCGYVLRIAGKLFPGPHLFAGAAIVALWAVAAALVPAMQKGNENARNAHIALNVLNLGLFIWQVSTAISFRGQACRVEAPCCALGAATEQQGHCEHHVYDTQPLSIRRHAAVIPKLE